MLKVDKINEDTKQQLAVLTTDKNVSLDEFKVFCRDVINQGVSSKSKKESFIRDIDKSRNKESASWTVYNYILAGEGNKVI